MRQSAIQVVVFDAVGTLIYPEPDVATIYAAVGRRFGSTLDHPEVGRRFCTAFKNQESGGWTGEARTSEEVERDRWRQIVKFVLADVQDAEGCFSELFAHFARPDSWRAFADVPDALAALHSSGYRVGVASNFDGRLFEIIRAIEPLRQADFILASSEIGFRKPHRRFFDAIVSRAAVAPAAVVYVGDDPTNDVVGARAAGMHALHVDRLRPNDPATVRPLRELVFSVL